MLDPASGLILDGSSRLVDGIVNVCIPDGGGGYYIGGKFTSVGGHPRTHLAHIRADRSLDPWAPSVAIISAFEGVRSLALLGSTLYVAGDFTSLGGQSRAGLGAVDAATGLATSWDPQPSGKVNAVAISATGTVLAGGYFTAIGGQARNRLAELIATSGTATGWDPNPDNEVDCILATAPAIYVGGGFLNIGGQPRSHLGAIDPLTGLATAWNPVANSYVLSIASSGTTIYVSGPFSSIGGQSRYGVAAIDAGGGAPTSWNPALTPSSAGATCVATDGSTVYVGGQFSVMGGQLRHQLAAIDGTTGLATAWDPGPDKPVYSLAVSGSTLYAAGVFTLIGMAKRVGFAAIDLSTAQLLPWDPHCNATSNQMALNGSTVYLAGSFTSVQGQPRMGLAAVDAATAQLTPWDPGLFTFDQFGLAPPLIRGMQADAASVYIVGVYNSPGGGGNHLAALDPTSGQTTWRVDADNNVYALAQSGSTLYAGGAFSSVGGQGRSRVAAVNATNGQVLPWGSDADADVDALLAAGSVLYAGGEFTRIGGQDRLGLAAIDGATGQVMALNPGVDGAVGCLGLDGSALYLGGFFTHVAGQSRTGVAAVNVTTGQPLPWTPDIPLGNVFSIAVAGARVFLGGNFPRVSGQLCPNFAALQTFQSPTATLASLVSAEVRDGRARVVWQTASSAAATIERSRGGEPWSTLSIGVPDGLGRISIVDDDLIPGVAQGYRLRLASGDALAEVWLTVPSLSFALGAPRANPSDDGLSVSLTLPDAAPARLELLDVTGQLRLTRELGSLGSGRHEIMLARAGELTPGLYFVRARRGPASSVVRVSVVR